VGATFQLGGKFGVGRPTCGIAVYDFARTGASAQ
jgi:hypothetical protein